MNTEKALAAFQEVKDELKRTNELLGRFQVGGAFALIQQELDRQKALPNAADIAAQEAQNTLNDRVATALAYLGRVPQTVFRNTREGCDPTENLVKAAAVLVAAIEATLPPQESSNAK